MQCESYESYSQSYEPCFQHLPQYYEPYFPQSLQPYEPYQPYDPYFQQPPHPYEPCVQQPYCNDSDQSQPSLVELMRQYCESSIRSQLCMQVCIDKLEEIVSQQKKTSEDMGDCTMTETFVGQDLNSLHDPSLDLELTKFSELDTGCTYDSNMCDEINSSIPLGTNLLPNIDSLLGIYHFPHK